MAGGGVPVNPLTERLQTRMSESLRREIEECRPLHYEAMKAAWLDGYDAMLSEVTSLLAFLPEEAECGRPTRHVRSILDALRKSLPIWRELSESHREFQAKHGRREIDMQNRWLNDKEVTP